MQRPSGQRRQTERRRLYDRRSPFPRRQKADRRGDDRRARETDAVARERRRGNDRRSTDRRDGERRRVATRRQGKRRRETPTPYSIEQLQLLREAFSHRGVVACPACSGKLSLGVPHSRGKDQVRRVSCVACGKAAILANTQAVRVLVVEEKDEVRDALRSILGGAGHDVIEVADAGVGLAAYESEPTDVVFIDVRSPGRMEAPEFVRRLRRQFPDCRIVGISTRASQAVADPLAIVKGLGAAGTIRMPFSATEVLRAVDDVRA